MLRPPRLRQAVCRSLAVRRGGRPHRARAAAGRRRRQGRLTRLILQRRPGCACARRLIQHAGRLARRRRACAATAAAPGLQRARRRRRAPAFAALRLPAATRRPAAHGRAGALRCSARTCAAARSRLFWTELLD